MVQTDVISEFIPTIQIQLNRLKIYPTTGINFLSLTQPKVQGFNPRVQLHQPTQIKQVQDHS
jgi:hypothetical protein